MSVASEIDALQREARWHGHVALTFTRVSDHVVACECRCGLMALSHPEQPVGMLVNHDCALAPIAARVEQLIADVWEGWTDPPSSSAPF